MARICAECMMPVVPVNECLCDDDEGSGALAVIEPDEDPAA